MHRPEYRQDLFPYWTSIKVRFRDLDPLNHVNNAIFSTYYEEARIDLIREVPEISTLLEKGFSFVLARIKINFINPVSFPDDLLVGSGITKLGNSSISSFQAIYKGGDKSLVSTAEASGVWFDIQKQRPSPLPDIQSSDMFLIDIES